MSVAPPPVPDTAALAALAARVCGAGPGGATVAVAAVRVGAGGAGLHPAEAAALGRAAPARLAEFAAGRAAARAALRRLGLPDAGPILPGPGRQPLWPAGFAGSLSHAEGAAVAAVARTEDAPGLGLDLEPARPLPDDLVDEICTAAERAGLEPAGPLAARLVFSAKETVFKALFPLGGTWLGFHDAVVALHPARGQFTATLLRDAPPLARGAALTGRYGIAGGFVMTALVLPPPGQGAGG